MKVFRETKYTDFVLTLTGWEIHDLKHLLSAILHNTGTNVDEFLAAHSREPWIMNGAVQTNGVLALIQEVLEIPKFEKLPRETPELPF